MRNRIVLGLITVLTMTSVVTSCGEAPTDVSHARLPRIAVIPPAMTSPFHVALRDGAVEQAKILGWPIEVQAPERKTDFAGQEMIVEQLIQKGVDIISINLIDANAMISGVRKANEAKIPILMHNMITPVSEGNVVEYICRSYDTHWARQLAPWPTPQPTSTSLPLLRIIRHSVASVTQVNHRNSTWGMGV